MLQLVWLYDNHRFFVFVFWHVPYVFVHGYVRSLLMTYVPHLPYENSLFSGALWCVSNRPSLVAFSIVVFVFAILVVIFVLRPPTMTLR